MPHWMLPAGWRRHLECRGGLFSGEASVPIVTALAGIFGDLPEMCMHLGIITRFWGKAWPPPERFGLGDDVLDMIGEDVDEAADRAAEGDLLEGGDVFEELDDGSTSGESSRADTEDLAEEEGSEMDDEVLFDGTEGIEDMPLACPICEVPKPWLHVPKSMRPEFTAKHRTDSAEAEAKGKGAEAADREGALTAFVGIHMTQQAIFHWQFILHSHPRPQPPSLS